MSVDQVWRLHRRQFHPLVVTGSIRYGGRWNYPGVPMLYASTHVSLALLETLVHVSMKSYPPDMVASLLSLPVATKRIEETLDERWQINQTYTRSFGSKWLSTQSDLALWVPSAVVPLENNVLINTRHPDFLRVTVVEQHPVDFDARLKR